MVGEGERRWIGHGASVHHPNQVHALDLGSVAANLENMVFSALDAMSGARKQHVDSMGYGETT